VIPVVEQYGGTIVDVGSGNGSPGIPVALAFPDREVALLEADGRKCDFLEQWAPANARVLRGRAEEQELGWAGLALAKALAPPPVAAEWCLPLVREGGAAVLWLGQSADLELLASAAKRLAAELAAAPPGLAVLRKTGPTPAGFPRRTGVARKRPLS
jgi:16S rRNA (guanine527-N7)-methyltransferase